MNKQINYQRNHCWAELTVTENHEFQKQILQMERNKRSTFAHILCRYCKYIILKFDSIFKIKIFFFLEKKDIFDFKSRFKIKIFFRKKTFQIVKKQIFLYHGTVVKIELWVKGINRNHK